MLALVTLIVAFGAAPGSDIGTIAPEFARVQDPVDAIAVGMTEEMLKPLLLKEKRKLNLDVYSGGNNKHLIFCKQRVVVVLCSGRVISVRKVQP
jgi:hypothetical protein